MSEARAINELAAARGAKVAIGLYAESALGTLISLQQAAALSPGQALVAAEQTFFLEMHEQVLSAPLVIRDGRVTLPDDANIAAGIDWRQAGRLKPG